MLRHVKAIQCMQNRKRALYLQWSILFLEQLFCTFQQSYPFTQMLLLKNDSCLSKKSREMETSPKKLYLAFKL